VAIGKRRERGGVGSEQIKRYVKEGEEMGRKRRTRKKEWRKRSKRRKR
jgi:hypothetical protein